MKTKNYFPVALVLFLFTLLSCNSEGENAANNKTATVNPVVNPVVNKFSDTGLIRLPNSQVCMINNKFMNKDQIAVAVNNKTYYGCCEGCVKKLSEDPTSRFATDPLSGNQVDKAIAYIIGKPGTKDDVLYFKSETNAREYSNKYFQQKR